MCVCVCVCVCVGMWGCSEGKGRGRDRLKRNQVEGEVRGIEWAKGHDQGRGGIE